MPPLFRAYLAISADGFIARPDGSVDWLHDYDPAEFGFEAFMAGIGSIVMGRASYEMSRSFGDVWPYAGKTVYVVTAQDLQSLPRDTRTHRADFATLAAELRQTSHGDVWLFGGPQLWAGFLDIGAIDRFELYVIPHMIGEGMPLLPPGRRDLRLELVESEALSRGVTKLVYKQLL
ncbi:dihydrofolate reductase family protein [Ferrovibrio sp.]|uniref:dihydrofolate reductase family protein n=1 Tax=Ferrovibrio sp. TaxID=1917215 RepID=UPI00263992BD|nr:dihydrofolate reductase family protein [Ferrovibrio sp.]